MRRHALVLLSFLAAAMPASADSIYVLDAGPARVELDGTAATACDGGAGLCVLHHEDHGTTAPGDDEVVIASYIREARVDLEPPVGPEPPVTGINFSELRVGHPAWGVLNQTWVRANDTLPGVVKQYVTLEARHRQIVDDDGTWHDDTTKYGDFVVVHLPFEVGHMDRVDAGVCWYPCYSDFPQLYSDEDEVGVNDVHLGDDGDTDSYVQIEIDALTACWFDYVGVPEAVCDARAAPRGPLLEGAALVASVTPSARLGFRLERAAVGDAPDARVARADEVGEAAPGEAGLAPVPSRAGADGLLLGGGADAPARSLATSVKGEPSPWPASPPALEGFVEGAAREPGMLLLLVAGAAALLLGALYHRIARERALEQDTRRRIFEVIGAEPGVRVGTLAQRLGLAYKSVQRHVQLLEEMGYVQGSGAGQRRYVVAGQMPAAEAAVLTTALCNPAARAVYEHVVAHGASDMGSLGSALGLAPSTLSMAAARLRVAGLVASRRHGKRVVLQAVAPRSAGLAARASHPAPA